MVTSFQQPAMLSPYVAPLWPAGHLPHSGGDWPSSRPSLIDGVAGKAPTTKLLISPLVGEMAGRPAGGNVERRPSLFVLVEAPRQLR